MAMNAREYENYLAISCSSSASKSVKIFWAEIYRGQLFFRAESSLIQSQTPDSFRIRYQTWFIRWIQNLKSRNKKSCQYVRRDLINFKISI